MDIERIRKTWTEGGDAFLIVRKLPVIHKGRATKSWRGHSHSCDNSRYLFYIGLMLLLLSVLCYLYKSFSEKAMAPHSSSLSWKIPWMEEPGRLQSMWSLRVEHDWATSLSLFTFMHWRRKWQPTPVFLPGDSQGQGNLVGCRLWGCTESDTTEAT